jgi:hypothetical protein
MKNFFNSLDDSTKESIREFYSKSRYRHYEKWGRGRPSKEKIEKRNLFQREMAKYFGKMITSPLRSEDRSVIYMD